MRPERAWVRLESGRRLNLLQPDPDSWTDRDLAVGLSRTYRWGGHSCWNLPLSVAQHSLLVLVLRQKIAPLDTMTREEALRELLHDADEMLGFDPISPLKPHLGADYAEASDHPASIEGVIVDGERDGEGGWDFDAPFTVLTTDEELIVCHGDCYVEVQ